MYPFQRILVATDFGESSVRAVELARGLAKEYQAELTVVHVVELLIPPYPIAVMPDMADLDAAARQSLDGVIERLQHELPRTRSVILHGHPAEQIISHTEQHPVDLVVVGTHGRKGPSRWLMGSIAEKVVRSCRVPVLTVHERDQIAVGQRVASPADTSERAPEASARH